MKQHCNIFIVAEAAVESVAESVDGRSIQNTSRRGTILAENAI